MREKGAKSKSGVVRKRMVKAAEKEVRNKTIRTVALISSEKWQWWVEGREGVCDVSSEITPVFNTYSHIKTLHSSAVWFDDQF